jgi:hypothetical protein
MEPDIWSMCLLEFYRSSSRSRYLGTFHSDMRLGLPDAGPTGIICDLRGRRKNNHFKSTCYDVRCYSGVDYGLFFDTFEIYRYRFGWWLRATGDG